MNKKLESQLRTELRTTHYALRTVYEDNHIIAVNKRSGELVQGDKTGDECLIDSVKAFIKQRDKKTGNVFLGSPHRLDRPTSGIVLFAKTSKALSRLSEMFKNGEIHKTYLALMDSNINQKTGETLSEGVLEDYLYRVEKLNKSFVCDKNKQGAKKAVLKYRFIQKTERYFLYEIELLTGRHHQIRAQFSNIGMHIKGDLKYGAKRSNPDGSISLHSYKMTFVHPVSKKNILVVAPSPFVVV